jgi:hypothetical protein
LEASGRSDIDVPSETRLDGEDTPGDLVDRRTTEGRAPDEADAGSFAEAELAEPSTFGRSDLGTEPDHTEHLTDRGFAKGDHGREVN